LKNLEGKERHIGVNVYAEKYLKLDNIQLNLDILRVADAYKRI
jgi:hypothetical protein